MRLEAYLALLWALELVHLAAPVAALTEVLSLGLAVYVAAALVGLRWQTLVLCLALATATAGLCLWFGVWTALSAGLERSLIFAAFMPTIVALRATAEERPEIASARALYGALTPAQRGAGLLFAAHVMGSVLSVGIFAVLAPIVGGDDRQAQRLRTIGVILRGMCSASMWSPFFVGMGLVSHYLPAVPLWQIVTLGLALAMCGLGLSWLMFERGGGTAGLRRSLSSLAPVVPAVAVAALVVVATTAWTPLSTLQALVVAMPPLCIVSLALAGRARLGAAVRATRGDLAKVRGEICILTLAVVLGTVLEAALAEGDLAARLAGLSLAPISILALTVGGMCVAGLLGLHPIVSASVLLVVLAKMHTGIADLVLMQAVLIGWGLGAMISISGIAIAIASALFAVPPEKAVRGENILFVVAFTTPAILVLAALNGVMVD